MPVVIAPAIQGHVTQSNDAGAVARTDCAATINRHISKGASAAECAAAVNSSRTRSEATVDKEFACVDGRGTYKALYGIKSECSNPCLDEASTATHSPSVGSIGHLIESDHGVVCNGSLQT